MKHIAALAILALVTGCEAVTAQMEQQSDACAARGGVLTASGCVGGGGSPSFDRPQRQCTSRSSVRQDGDTTVTDTDAACHG